MDFTLEATGSFTFGTDIQSYVKTLLCMQIMECFPWKPIHVRPVLQDQGETGKADWQILTQVLEFQEL